MYVPAPVDTSGYAVYAPPPFVDTLNIAVPATTEPPPVIVIVTGKLFAVVGFTDVGRPLG